MTLKSRVPKSLGFGVAALLGLFASLLGPGKAYSGLILEYDSPVGMTIETLGIVRVDAGMADGRTDKSFHAPEAGFLEVWFTEKGIRKKKIINRSVSESYTYKWTEFGDQDREIIFKPAKKKGTVQKEAFFSSGVMQHWDDFWNGKPVGFSSVWPFILDVEDNTDLFVGVDLTTWHNSAVAFYFGDVISITGGQSALLPGFTIGTTDIDYVEGAGWTNPQPFTGFVQLGASDGSVVPEPTSFVTLSGVLGMGLIGYWSRRRRLSRR